MLVSLVAVLTLTSALLLVLQPPPLGAQASSSLFAIDGPQSLDVLFEGGDAVVPADRWHYIYIHHSARLSGNAKTLSEAGSGLADHFVIGNGDGCGDGEVQIGQRWTQQQPPGLTPGANYIYPDCISICLVGDFSQTRPTATQQRRLAQLVSAIQVHLHIPRERVYFDVNADSAAGVGHYFPAQELRGQILP
jgi:hypothetical protein